MNNQNIGRVSVRTSRRKRSPFNWSHDVNASMRVGEILPSVVREIIPNTKFKVNTRNIVRLAPLVAPSYANLNLKHKMYFVGMSDLTRNFTAFMAKQPVNRAGRVFTPNMLPHVPLSFLSALCMIGARGTLYALRNGDDDTGPAVRFNLGNWNSSLESHAELANVTAFSHFFDGGNGLAGIASEPVFDTAVDDNLFYKKVMPESWQALWNGYNGPAINIGRINPVYHVDPSESAFEFWVPFGNTRGLDFWEDNNPDRDLSDGYTVVPIDKADAVYRLDYPNSGAGDIYYLAVRFSSFGERIYNLMLSTGTGFDPLSKEPVSLMPFFATWKAYFESFGLLRYRNYETSPCAGILDDFDESNEPDIYGKIVDSQLAGTPYLDRFIEFLMDLGFMFWTSETDFTSAHTRTPVIASAEWNVNGLLSGPNPPDGPQNEFSVTGVSGAESDHLDPTDGGARMVGQFTQLDLEKMQRLYKVINRETVAGRKLAEILRLNGLGDYVDNVVSRYLGEDTIPIDIDEIDATNDAFDGNGEVSTLLGEQGAKGTGFGVTRKHSLQTNEYGYFIVLSAIVPEVGFSQQGKAQAHNLKPLDFYNPEFDGLGFEENPKSLTVVSIENFADPGTEPLDRQGFGFVPMYSRHKFMPNLCLGAFALESEQADSETRYLDRHLEVGKRYVSEETEHTSYKVLTVVKSFPSSRVPIASPTYRFIGRYPWLENYVRIFANQGNPAGGRYHFPAEALGHVDRYIYSDRQPIQFYTHLRFVWPVMAPMLQFEDSFETKENGTVGESDLSIGKA